MIKKVLIVYDHRKEKLKKHGKEIFRVFAENFDDIKIIPVNKSFSGKDYDIVIVFGGDGTLLWCVKKLGEHQIPILGINVGKFGFLTYVELQQLKNCVEHLKNRRFNIQDRMLLEIQLKGFKTHIYNALNETVIHRQNLARILEISFFINGKYIATIIGDGIIISTPTGSTAHSLSAGGPIVCPQLENIIITPLNAHTLNVRPLIISSDDTINIKLADYKNTTITFDGREIVTIPEDTEIIIRKSKKYAKFITFENWNFLRLLVDKFYWGIKKTNTIQ
ncbi:MAG: NAD(+)/NADH kinase [Planctomycetota bacterium]